MATATKTIATHITKDPRVCGGKACIDHTRIRVMDVVLLQRQGKKPEDMIDYFSLSLSLAQIHGALTYYYDHPEEIEAEYDAHERTFSEGVRARD